MSGVAFDVIRNMVSGQLKGRRRVVEGLVISAPLKSRKTTLLVCTSRRSANSLTTCAVIRMANDTVSGSAGAPNPVVACG